MNDWTYNLQRTILHPAILIITMPMMCCISFLFTLNFILSFVMYVWATVLYVSGFLLRVEKFRSDWKLMVIIHVLFFSAHSQILLYVSLRMA